MNTTPIALGHLNGINLVRSDPPFNNYQAFAANYEGLNILAGAVRELEIQYVAKEPYAAHVVLLMNSQVPELVPCALNWFSVTLVNYLRLIGLVQLMSANGWKSSALVDPSNREHQRIAQFLNPINLIRRGRDTIPYPIR
jgi:hypothetical protein